MDHIPIVLEMDDALAGYKVMSELMCQKYTTTTHRLDKMNYVLSYSDMQKITVILNSIGGLKIPGSFTSWSPKALMSILSHEGSYMYVCDATYPNLPESAIKDLAHVIASQWIH